MPLTRRRAPVWPDVDAAITKFNQFHGEYPEVWAELRDMEYSAAAEDFVDFADGFMDAVFSGGPLGGLTLVSQEIAEKGILAAAYQYQDPSMTQKLLINWYRRLVFLDTLLLGSAVATLEPLRRLIVGMTEWWSRRNGPNSPFRKLSLLRVAWIPARLRQH